MSRKKSLSSHLSRKDPDETEFDAAVKELQEGSDRVAAIMGSALVENNLVKALEAALPEPTEKADFSALFYDEGAPFGTFKRRIVAAKALAVVSPQMAADMDIVRDIRNQFAHALLALHFDNEHIARSMDTMTNYRFALAERDVSANRFKWEKACWGISLHLLRAATNRIDARNKTLLARAKLRDLQTALLQSGSDNALSHLFPVESAVKD